MTNNLGPIGSDFESLTENELSVDEKLPWVREGVPIAYMETGRQVLDLLAESLRKRGRKRILVPGHLCESMIIPFSSRGWDVQSFGIREDLGVPVGASSLLDHAPDQTVVLLAAYFGRLPDRSHKELARRAQESGAVVIEDATHRVFTPETNHADFTFASLRKLLPIADGAYVQGDSEVLRRVSSLPASDSNRWVAMDLKREALQHRSHAAYRTLFLKSNRQLETEGRRFAPTLRTMRELARLPFDRMSRRRVENGTMLSERLDSFGIPVLPLEDGQVPSHIVVRLSNPRKYQERLAKDGIYSSIHWPVVERIQGIDRWHDDLLSLPVDHRYGPQHIAYIASTIAREVTR